MSFYVIQVKTGAEEKYCKRAQKLLQPGSEKLLWPRRSLRLRRRGLWRDSVSSIFPGYLFLQTKLIAPELYRNLKKVPGFTRFLKDNANLEPLSSRDREILLHFLSFGEIVHRSTVSFGADRRIRVIAGPLKTLEGRIVRVDRRKGRAQVRLELYDHSFLIDFGFEALESVPEPRRE